MNCQKLAEVSCSPNEHGNQIEGINLRDQSELDERTREMNSG
jgi:hypothetical protein